MTAMMNMRIHLEVLFSSRNTDSRRRWNKALGVVYRALRSVCILQYTHRPKSHCPCRYDGISHHILPYQRTLLGPQSRSRQHMADYRGEGKIGSIR